MTSITRHEVIYDDGSVDMLEPKRSSILPGIYLFALHDFQTRTYFRQSWGYSVPRSLFEDTDKLRNDIGYPEMVPLKPRNGVMLTKQLQWFWVRQIVLSMYGISLLEYKVGDRLVTIQEEFKNKLDSSQQNFIINAWHGITKGHTAFCNGRGTDHCRDYIGGLNSGSTELPILWENTCGGHTLLVNSQTVTSSMEWIEVKTLKVSEYHLWKNADYRQSKWRPFFTLATNSTPYKVGTVDTVTKAGPWKVEPMHYLGGKSIPVPLISHDGYVYVYKDRVRILGQIESFPNPYTGYP